ncbi:MAG: NapC/NirT family cytochrome c [Candidatus Methylomirabilis sp.]|nr:NapC/NirT family cytochrome c [Deltaproteobacteria bacterium]
MRGILWTALLVAVVALLGYGGMEGTFYYTNQPQFCASCHIMDPYYDSWKESTHAEAATCVQCHYAPHEADTIRGKMHGVRQAVQYVMGIRSVRPFANIADASCLECHPTTELAKPVMLPTGREFDHLKHLEVQERGQILKCASCHTQIMENKHIEVDPNPCFICHFKNKEKQLAEGREICITCHAPDMVEEVTHAGLTFDHAEYAGRDTAACTSCHQSVVHGEGKVNRVRCLVCHTKPGDTRPTEEMVPELHRKHIQTQQTACVKCHDPIEHYESSSVATHLQGTMCAHCHAGMHEVVSAFYLGQGAQGVPDTPTDMSRANVSCEGCHAVAVMAATNGGASRPGNPGTRGVEAQCLACHGEDYEGFLDDRKGDVEEYLERGREALARAEAALKAKAHLASAEEAAEAESALKTARENFALVEQAGFHNVDYAEKIIDGVESTAEEIAALGDEDGDEEE